MNLIEKLHQLLINLGVSSDFVLHLKAIIVVAIVAIIAIIVNFIAKKTILQIVHQLVKKSTNQWDDALLERKVFNFLSHFAPAIFIYYACKIAFNDFPAWIEPIQTGTYIYMIVVTIMVINAFINASNDIYQTLPAAKNRSIKGYLQVAKIIIYIFGATTIISIIIGKSPATLLAGLGAFTAVLMLIFQDSIKGLVSGIQLSANDMLRPGDWVSIPAKNIDGTVLEITLNTVKVQNWDKTISTVPTYTLVSESFNNWRGMEESGGRRVMRSINIDIRTIKPCSAELLDKFEKNPLLKEYVKKKRSEISEYNQKHHLEGDNAVWAEKISNIEIFRKYLKYYLKTSSFIKSDMSLIVRQLEVTDKGLPVQVYFFSKIQTWAEFEDIQSNLIAHIFSVISEFELKIFQSPTGNDMLK